MNIHLSWLERIGLTDRQAMYVLKQSRLADDDNQVQRASIVGVHDGVAIVERTSWNGTRLLDYPVRVR